MSVSIVNRKQMILESLVKILEEDKIGKITTKVIAEKTDVTEAALYKHFRSKGEIFQELFKFIDTVLSDKLNEIKMVHKDPLNRTRNIFQFLILFVETNPGFARILNREALTTDEQDIKDSVNLLLTNIEKELYVILNNERHARYLMTMIEGTYTRFIRSEFKELPSSYMDDLWMYATRCIFA